ncbi:hypothetical protein [Granulicella mallensis]|uniref:Lipoprotein n=1 Tax=Granulicella mallensis (strain ATCC BAA-1857 / DSM 23137 / MP5ACTX8) TaxID=682795 RepID=G8P0X7_GRAMM|nr:hypothetical protein [Granulicella mallensis]AEU35824.1 hypothetical protein AciX8_1482 [Granulicella mallensis MP5ACTX8]
MRLIDNFVGRYVAYPAVAALLAACITMSAPAQQNPPPGGHLVDDWTHHHVIFSDPGTEQDAIKKGRHAEWLRIVNDPRYRMQQIRRAAEARQASHFGSDPWNDREHDRRRDGHPPAGSEDESIQRDWAVTVGAAGASTAIDTYPAKFTFDVNAVPSCSQDYVIYPVNVAGSTTQANILGVNNLYKTTCTTGTVPNVEFAYNVGTGIVETSPVLSEDGTKVAFVESIQGGLLNLSGSIFHVLTLGTNGNTGCPSSPCNGNASNKPVAPGTLNNAKDVKILMQAATLLGLNAFGSTDFKSSPFVDYTNDIAYIGDLNGVLHKFTGVFQGIPAEVITGGWPFVAPVPLLGTAASFGSPVFDGGASQNIYVASLANGSNTGGQIFCVTTAGAACATPSIQAGTGGIQDSPIVDSTTEKIFVTNNNGSSNALLQVSTSLASASLITANMGAAGTDLYDGAFDNAYFANGTNTGHMYFCGGGTLYQVPISNGTMGTAAAATTLKLSTATGGQADCTPLTEVFNPNITISGTTGHDLLFLGVTNKGAPTGCNGGACIMTFDITSGAVPTAPIATFPLATGTTLLGTSGLVIDNVSTSTGGSQVYFGNLNAGTGVQASQAGLQ